MPRGPKGEKRPADVIGNAVHVMRIATGEIEEDRGADKRTIRSEAGRKGGKARARLVAPQRRTKIAKDAAKARWARKRTMALKD